MANWFVSKSGYDAHTAWAASTAYTVGQIRKQLSVTGTNHRLFKVDSISGTGTSGGSEPSWNLTKDSTTTDNAGANQVVWREITGKASENPTSFAAPHAWLQHAASWSAAGDTIYVDDDHAETQAAANTIVAPGTTASPTNVICITSTFTNPPVAGEITTTAVGANIATTGSNHITISGALYCYGLHFKAGATTGDASVRLNFTSSQLMEVFEACTLECGGTGGGALLGGASNYGGQTTFIGCTFTFASAVHTMVSGSGAFTIIGGSLGGAAVPDKLLGWNFGADGPGNTVLIDGMDINSAGTWTGKYLFNATNTSFFDAGLLVKFVRCKLSTTLGGVVTGTFPVPRIRVELISSDNTSTPGTYREEYYDRTGTLTTETTIVRTGGASDGTTTKSWKVITTANCSYMFPFVCPDIYQWVGSTGAKNIDIQIAHSDGGGLLKPYEIGLEVEYMGATTSPVATTTTTKPTILTATGTDWTDVTGTETWGGSQTYEQRMRATVTVNQVGWIRVRVHVIQASLTVYIDPLITVS